MGSKKPQPPPKPVENDEPSQGPDIPTQSCREQLMPMLGQSTYMAVLKYELKKESLQRIKMPIGAKIIHVGSQNGSLCLWAYVDEIAKNEVRLFDVFGDDQSIDTFFADYIHRGTAIISDTTWHVFERIEPTYTHWQWDTSQMSSKPNDHSEGPPSSDATVRAANLNVSLSPEGIRRIAKCVEIVDGYGHFREGQDGFQAMLEIRQFVDELEGKLSPYGYCPHCGKAGVFREARPNGNDTCEEGHVYPSRVARH